MTEIGHQHSKQDESWGNSIAWEVVPMFKFIESITSGCWERMMRELFMSCLIIFIGYIMFGFGMDSEYWFVNI